MQDDAIGCSQWTIPNATVTSQGLLVGTHCHLDAIRSNYTLKTSLLLFLITQTNSPQRPTLRDNRANWPFCTHLKVEI